MERFNLPWRFVFSKIRRLWLFHVVVSQRTAKNCKSVITRTKSHKSKKLFFAKFSSYTVIVTVRRWRRGLR